MGFKLADMPPDKEHPFGHGRYEYVSGFVVSLIISIPKITAEVATTSLKLSIAAACNVWESINFPIFLLKNVLFIKFSLVCIVLSKTLL